MTSNEPDFEMIADALNDLATAQENGSLSAAGQYPAAAIRDEIATLEEWVDRDALKPKEIWLGNGDKGVADIYAEDGSYAGIGIFQPENGRTGAIGQSEGEIDGRPLDEVNAIVLIKSTRPESLQVVVEELQEAMARLGSTPTKADERISVHEYTARMSLEALKFYTEWMQRNACGDPEPIEHHYAMQAIEEIEYLLPEPPKEQDDE